MEDSRGENRVPVIYGYGSLGQLANEVFDKFWIDIEMVIDRHPGRAASLKQVTRDIKKDCLCVVCIATTPYHDIYQYLKKRGWRNMINVYDIFDRHPEFGITSGWRTGPSSREDLVSARYVTDRFYDNTSMTHWYSFKAWHTLRQEVSRGLIDKYFPQVITLPSTLADIEARRKVVIYPDEPMEEVSIHAEGCELETIEKNLALFQKYRPKLKVACYHTRDGLWKIERTLMEALEDYRWDFRVYSYQGQAAYLYGTPTER